MIIFTKLTLQNFLSYREKQTIPLSNQGIVRLEGQNLDEPSADSNMAGKSSIIEALLWCLFGKTIREVKHDAVVNRFAKRDCRVRVDFTVESIPYHVIRYRKHRKKKNRVYLFRGAKNISPRHEDQTQLRIQQVCGCDFRIFSNSVVFGGTKPFAALTDSEQKKVFESFLHFEEFDKALTFTKAQISEVKEKLNECTSKLQVVKAEVKAAKDKIEILKTSQRRATGEKAGELRTLIKRLHELPSGLEERSGQLVKILDLQQAAVKRYSKAVTICEQEISQIKNAIHALHGAKVQKGSIGTSCQACGQEITEQSRKAYQEHLQRDKKKLEKELAAVVSLLPRLRKEANHAEHKLEKLLEKQTKRKLLLEKQRDLEERIERMRREIRSSSLFEKELEDAYSGYAVVVSSYLRCTNSLLVVRDTLKNFQFWETGFGNKGIKSLIIRQALPAMNAKLAEYANRLFGNSATIEFVPTKETKSGEERDLFHIRYAASKGSASYKGESSGGRRRIDIAILLALSWLSRVSNLLMVDELLDGLDETGREIALEVLSELRGTILVISHRKEMKSKIGKVWTVTKKGGFSTISTDG